MKDVETITAVIGKIPQWIRHDLAAQEATLRERAEEALAAIIAAALEKAARKDAGKAG